MRVVSFLLLIALLSCHSSADVIGPERVENAFIDDSSRYADGCELSIRLDSGNSSGNPVQYKPTPATLSLAQRVVTAVYPKDPLNIPVKIRFIETTNKVVIHCGWVSPTVTEIKILEIIPR